MRKTFGLVCAITLILIIVAANFFLFRLNAPRIETIEIPVISAEDRLSSVDRIALNNFRAFTKSPATLGILRAPAGVIDIEQLYVDRCEVRQGGFYEFATWIRSHPEPSVFFAATQPSSHKFMSSSIKSRVLGQESSPANGITFYDAYAYCRAAGGRLPTDQEWNAMAAGKNGNLYPWGDTMNYAPWTFGNPKINTVNQCGSYPETNTETGINAMGSGVSEWTMGNFPDGKPSLSGANGYWKPVELYAMSFVRRAFDPLHRSPVSGLRCVYDQKPKPVTPWGESSQTVLLPPGKYAYGPPQNSIFSKILPHTTEKNREEMRQRLYAVENEEIGGFAMSKYEITVEQYASFLADPFTGLGFFANADEPNHVNYIPRNWERQRKFPQKPVTNIDWWSAFAFANWVDGDLPTAKEWNQAFSDDKTNFYPWGEKYEPLLALTLEAKQGTPVERSFFAKDTTRLGFRHMGGNVSEWTKSVIPNEKGFEMVVKGGSFRLPGKETANFDFFRSAPPQYASDNIGFRIVFRP